MAKFNVALVGAGYTTTAPIKAFSNLPEVTVAVVLSRAIALAALYGAIFASFVDDLYAQTRADLLVVSVSKLGIAGIARRCFRHSWQVHLEKPAKYKLPDTQEIPNVTQAAGTMVHEPFNLHACSRTRAALTQLSDADGKRFIKVLDQQDQVAARMNHDPSGLVAKQHIFANYIRVIKYFRVFGRGGMVAATPEVAWNAEAPGPVIARVKHSSGTVGLNEGVWFGMGQWVVSISTPAKRIKMHPLKQYSVQFSGAHSQTSLELSEDDRTYRFDLRYEVDAALAALRREPANLADIDDSLQSMKLVADIFGIAG